jgi:hypothetical protein
MAPLCAAPGFLGAFTIMLWLLVAKSALTGCGHRRCGWGVRFGVRVCFEEEQSDTYVEQEVGKCPECGAWLNTDALLGAHDWVRGR